MNFSPQQRNAGNTAGVIQGTAYGLPVGIVAVYVLDTYLLPHPMPGVIAGAVATIVNGASVWLAQWLPTRKRK